MRDLDRIITKYNRDINGNPVTNHIIRRHTVSAENYQVVLDFIPSEGLGVRILEPENLYQIYNSDELVEGTFYVDYVSGKVFFDKVMASKEILIDYYSIGLEMIGCERVYTCIAPNGDVLETLGDILNGGKEVLETLKTMGDIIVVIEELKENIKIGNDVYERLGSVIDETTLLLRDLTAKNLETRQTIADAEAKKQEVIIVTDNAEEKKQEVNVVIENADSKIGELESTVDSANTKKSELETTMSTSDTKKSELQTVIDNSNTKKSELQDVIDDSIAKKEELQTVIDNGDIITMLNRITELEKRGIKTLWTGTASSLNDVIVLSESIQNFDKFIVCANMFGFREHLCDFKKNEDIIINTTNLENNMESSVIQVFEIILEKVTDTELKIKFIKRVNNSGQINNTSMSITKIEGIKF